MCLPCCGPAYFGGNKIMALPSFVTRTHLTIFPDPLCLYFAACSLFRCYTHLFYLPPSIPSPPHILYPCPRCLPILIFNFALRSWNYCTLFHPYLPPLCRFISLFPFHFLCLSLVLSFYCTLSAFNLYYSRLFLYIYIALVFPHLIFVTLFHFPLSLMAPSWKRLNLKKKKMLLV